VVHNLERCRILTLIRPLKRYVMARHGAHRGLTTHGVAMFYAEFLVLLVFVDDSL
jgi:hypothetical protein